MSSKTRSVCLVASLAAIVLAGCGPSSETECSGHGKLQSNRCVCDAGYRVDPSNSTKCVAVTAPECGGRGTLVNGACQCELGYAQQTGNPRNCVAVPCGGHGTLSNGACTCDAGWERSPTDATVCLPAGGECGGHGLLVDGICDCNTGWKLDPANKANCIAAGDGTCTQASFNPEDEYVTLQWDGDDYFWSIEAYGATDQMFVDNYASFGGPTEPGTYTLTADDVSLADCAVCAVYSNGCKEDDAGEYTCAKDFMPKAGAKLEVTKVEGKCGGKYVAKLTNAVFQQVTIDWDEFTSTVKAGGQQICIPEYSWDLTVECDDCGGHGVVTDEGCKCDAGFKVDPADEENCIAQ